MTDKKLLLIKLALTSFILLGLIWGVGPFLAIGSIKPLATTNARLIPTLLITLSWLVGGIISYGRRSVPIFIDFDPMQGKLLQLQQYTITAIQAIKKHLPRQFGRKKAPWILLFGPSDAGKTTLLANADVRLHSPHDHTFKNIKNNQQIDWWISDHSVFIDPPGKFCTSSFTDQDFENQKLWFNFLKLVKQKRYRQPFDQLLVVINASSLLAPEAELRLLAERYIEPLQTLATQHKSLPITIVVTACDRLSGFVEFFADLGSEERQQMLGFSLMTNDDTLSIGELIHERANALIKRLNDRFIWRLHHEQNVTRRARIKDFPWQMQYLNQSLQLFLANLPINNSFRLTGVYFTSSLQTGSATNLLSQSIVDTLHLANQKSIRQASKNKPYFIQALFQQCIQNKALPLIKNLQTARYRLLSLPIALLIILILTFTWHHFYLKGKTAINLVEARLTEPSDEAPWLSQLNMLTDTIRLLEQSDTGDRWFGFGQTYALKKQLKTTYIQMLKTNFVLYLDQLITRQIQDDIDNNQPGLYNSLQTYLMLVQRDHLNTSVIIDWFKQHQNIGNADKNNALTEHLNHLLQLTPLAWPINYNLIKNAQHVLQQRPLDQNAFMILKSLYQNQTAVFTSDRKLLPFSFSNVTIAELYRTDRFDYIYNKKIPEIALQISQGNWVIGQTDAKPLDKEAANTLIQKMRSLYVQNYVAAWENVMSSITLTPPKTWEDVEYQLQLLSDPRSILWRTLENVLKNVVNQDNISINSDSLQKLLTLTQQRNQESSVYKDLLLLNQYVLQITHAPILNQAAYDHALIRLQNDGDNDPLTRVLLLSNQLPQPLTNWLKTITKSTWQLMLTASREQINAMWSSRIFPEYERNIANRYPILKDSHDEISVEHFNQFFGPGGTIESFFNTYLKPFVNMREVYWTWKSLDGLSIAIPQEKLDMLIRASMIQRMFYANNPDSPSVRFSLTPISLSENNTSFSINIGGKKISYELGVKKTESAVWPGPEGQFITLRFNTLSPNKPTKTVEGFWAWLRLLDASKLQATNDPKVFQVTFSLDDNQAVFQLTADNAVNPYQSQLLASFRCPDSL